MWMGGEDYFLVGKEHNFIDLEAEPSLLEDLKRQKTPSESVAPSSPSCAESLLQTLAR